MDAQVMAAAIGGVLGFASTVANIAASATGWVRRATALAELHARLPSDVNAFERTMTSILLSEEVYDVTLAGLGYRMVDGVPERHVPWWRGLGKAAAIGIACSTVAGAAAWALGSPAFLAAFVTLYALGIAIGWGGMWVLRRWPEKDWNPVYSKRMQMERDAEPIRERLRALGKAVDGKVDADVDALLARLHAENRVKREDDETGNRADDRPDEVDRESNAHRP